MEYYVKGSLVCLLDYANLKGKTCGTRSTCYHPNVVGSDPQGLKKSPKRDQHHYNYSIRENDNQDIFCICYNHAKYICTGRS